MRSSLLVLLAACAEPSGQLPPLFQPTPSVQLVGLADDGLVDVSACCVDEPVDITEPGFEISVPGGNQIDGFPMVSHLILPLATPLSIAYKSAPVALAIPAAFDTTAPVYGATVPSTTPLVIAWAPSADADTASIRVDADFECSSGDGEDVLGVAQGDPGTLTLDLSRYAGCSMTLHVIHEAASSPEDKWLQVLATQVRDLKVIVSP